MSVHDYSLKFILLAKYAPSLVSGTRNEMSQFVTGVSNDLQEECHSVMLHDIMNISHLMAHAKRIEEARAKRKDRYSKRTRSLDGGGTNGDSRQAYYKRFANQVPSKYLKRRQERAPRSRVQKEKSENSSNERQPCKEC